ncbi:Protein ecdysoneless-like protein [Colletotrichum spinosum]|uniref:Protein ecdysoneless-like protein n=1 Tax=Colletotrichum spinosum TaxID=1347390 RepID=A0A4R8PV05_9PEZI|nr:Protein ecdysoneless-like protein [Colletotrichum spinosum]
MPAGQAVADHAASSLPENFVEYSVFLPNAEDQSRSRRQLACLEDLRQAALQIAVRTVGDYIWHRESFNLEVVSNNGFNYLRGVLDYGDAIEDEWLVVYLLRELSKAHPAAWIRAADSDGEFLLVEAANVLPSWLSPENDHYRVWINDGRLRIVPPEDEANSPTRAQSLTLKDAMGIIETDHGSLLHSEFIQAEAFYRLEKYPDHIRKSLHHSVVKIPRKLAYVLRKTPKAVAPAVDSFYLRDALDLKTLLSQAESVHFPPTDFVTLSVKFSRVLFAQLRSQRFSPPPPWASIIQGAEAEDQERLLTGMKLTCGFEIMLKNAHKTGNRVAREASLAVEDLEEDGDVVLPTDAEISTWHDAYREDDDSWMNINFEDFERELQGGRKPENSSTGFGDLAKQADLRKLVSTFEAFLNDETAGPEGAELQEMDVDEEDSNDGSDVDEDKAVSFNEVEFSRMMREMMGLPSASEPIQEVKKTTVASATPLRAELDHREEELEQKERGREELQTIAAVLEAELNEYGALRLDTPAKKTLPKEDTTATGSVPAGMVGNAGNDDAYEDVDFDYNLAANILESFKSQAGLPGPAGNVLGLMGLQLPRDEDFGKET